ncbi:Supt5h [Symbiodinium microadriaticum]|nr:Supt5h [Symbiodinium microadriaticum]
MDSEALAAEELEANLLVERRHEANRKFQEQSAAELAAMYEDRYRSQGRGVAGRGGGYGGVELMHDDVQKQALIPGVHDPGIWVIRCKTGLEQTLVRSVLLKTMDNQAKGRPVLIKSCFCTPSAGYIYVEAMEEPFAREAVAGLHGLFYSTFKKVPVAEMTALLTVTVRKKPIKEGQWCRMKRGPLKGDLVKVSETR